MKQANPHPPYSTVTSGRRTLKIRAKRLFLCGGVAELRRVGKITFSLVDSALNAHAVGRVWGMRVKVPLISVFIAALSITTGCAELSDPNYGRRSGYPDSRYDNGGYYDDRPYYPPPRNSNYREDQQQRREWQEIERERERVDAERREVERQRREAEAASRRAPPPPPAAREERCPSGFRPSEQKCSREERRRGCQDMRLPGGLGCVKR